LLVDDCSAIIDCMASITIRNLDDQTKERLRVQAARHRRSMEAEARNVLRRALATPEASGVSLADAVKRRFRSIGGVELELPRRAPMRPPPKLQR
jgi:plasmid stability protein